jgi:hypothetical protein
MPQSQSTEQADFCQLADPDFLAERADYRRKRRIMTCREHG